MSRLLSFWNSLQCRLIGVTITVTLLVPSVAGGLTILRMHQQLLARTTLDHRRAIEQFRQDVATYQEMFSPEESLAKAVEKHSQVDRWFHPQSSRDQGEGIPLLGMDLANLTSQPTLVRYQDQDLIVCQEQLTLRDQRVVQFAAITDASDAYQTYRTFVRTLAIAGGIAILLATLLGLLLIRQALRPLHNISHLTASISAEHIGKAQLMLEDAPSEMKQLASAYNDMLNRLGMAWEQEQQLLSNISHELRTPLAIVQGYLEGTLRRGSNLTEIQAESLSISLEETKRVARMLKDLLDLARAESGTFHLQLEPILLNEWVVEVAALAKQLGSNPLTLQITDPPIWIKADSDRLKQVVLNLLTNAMRYSEPQDPITLHLEARGEWALLHIQDRGIGIPVEHQPYIFDRFYRVSHSRSRSEGGIGLGLAISKILVETMRGKITLESQPDQGSTFTVAFPVCQGEA
ncbi:MAG: ATP-binding protein [Cyanobacteriota bacterium]|nr:ATP-binding protein [Cyanobacteriota bacterium]